MTLWLICELLGEALFDVTDWAVVAVLGRFEVLNATLGGFMQHRRLISASSVVIFVKLGVRIVDAWGLVDDRVLILHRVLGDARFRMRRFTARTLRIASTAVGHRIIAALLLARALVIA